MEKKRKKHKRPCISSNYIEWQEYCDDNKTIFKGKRHQDYTDTAKDDKK